MMKVANVGDVQLGRQRSPKDHTGPHMRPYLRVANVYEDRLDLTDVKEMNFSPEEFKAFELLPGDILLNEGQSKELVGRPAMYRGEIPGACFQNTLIRFRSSDAVVPEYALAVFRYFMRTGEFQKICKWTTNIAHLGAQRFAEMEFPVPPLNEQKRIAVKITALIERADRSRNRLAGVSQTLKRFRVAVLEAAVSGKLTDEWRRIKGRELTSAGYHRLTIGDLVAEPLRNGKSVRDGSGVAVLRLTSIRGGNIDLRETKLGDWGGLDVRRFLIGAGDFLVSRGNGSKELVARGAIVGDVGAPIAFPDTMIRIRPRPEIVLPRFLQFVWDSALIRQQVEGVVRTTAGIWKISQSDLERISIPIPDFDEQKEIVRRINELFGTADVLGSRCRIATERVSNLTPSILRKAFIGRLVPQDPADEPASVLLERIRKVRKESSATPNRAQRTATDRSEVEMANPQAKRSIQRRTPRVPARSGSSVSRRAGLARK